MKIKTSITLSDDLLAVIDTHRGQYKTRSEFIETAVRQFVLQLQRAERNARDLAILNKHADRLNKEALDVLSYQVEL